MITGPDKMKRSILLDSQADLISYGMGERSIVEIADALDERHRGKGYHLYRRELFTRTENLDSVYDDDPSAVLPRGFRRIKRRMRRAFTPSTATPIHFRENGWWSRTSDRLYVVQNPAAKPLTQEEMDDVYALPYMRTYHPSYDAAGGIPAITEVKFSLISNRGCFGGCSFCALTFHQGRIVQTRSHESIIEEAEASDGGTGF